VIKKLLIILVLFFGIFWLLHTWFADVNVDEAAEAARIKACIESWNCIDQPSFQIDVSTISPWKGNTTWATVEESINSVLATIIQKMMIALWSLSLLIMTIGAGYMILYHGQDELLSKWKSIFLSGITALVVALGSYYLVALVRYILYAVN